MDNIETKLPLVWHPWTQNSVGVAYEAEREIGHGEYKLCNELDICLSSNKTYDLYDPNLNLKVEVKSCRGSFLSQPGNEGRTEIRGYVNRLIEIGSQAREYLEFCEYHDEFHVFLTEVLPKIEEGEIGKKTYETFVASVQAISNLISPLRKKQHDETRLTIDAKTSVLKKSCNSLVAARLVREIFGIEAANLLYPLNIVAASFLRDVAFFSGRVPKIENLTTRRFFEPAIDYLILVDPEGYMIIHASQIDDVLLVHSITKWAPRLSIRPEYRRKKIGKVESDG